MKKSNLFIPCFLFLAWLMTACGATATPPTPNTPVPLPTATAIPVTTAAPTAAPAPTVTPLPTATVLATATTQPTTAPTATPAPVSPTISGGVGFKQFTFPMAGFTIALPNTPTENKSSETALIGSIDKYDYYVKAGTTEYYVNVVQYPTRFVERDDLGGFKTLQEKRDELVKKYPPTRFTEESTISDQFVGRKYTLNLNNQTLLKSAIYLVGSSFYQITVRYFPNQQGTEDAEKFLLSFKPTAPKPVGGDWKLFGFQPSEFQIMLPDVATTSERTESTLIGSIVYKLYVVDQANRGVKWTAGDAKYPDRYFQKDDPDGTNAINDYRDKILKDTKGTLVSERPLTFDKYKGREIYIAIPNSGYVLAHLYVIGSRLYQIQLETKTAISSPAQATPLVPDASEIQRFFISFDAARP